MPPRILIAEDDDLQGTVVRSALQSRGYEADIVCDGLEAVRRLRTGRYDLALLDYHLPEVDGLVAARLLHELLSKDDRPRLIAITASAEGLSAKEGAAGGSVFDAVVSKGLGLPALLSAVDANLVSAAERNADYSVRLGRLAAHEAKATRRQRWGGLFAAAPAVLMASAFTAGFGWAVASLQHVDAAIGAARHADAVGVGTTALIGAVQDAEASQRTYLATGNAAHRQAFEADAQRVDQLLVAPGALAVDEAAGGLTVPQTVIEPRMRLLAHEADLRVANGATQAEIAPGRASVNRLRDWAAGLVSGAQVAVFAGLAAIRGNIQVLVGILGAGVVYGLWNAYRTVRRAWRTPPALRVPAHMGGWRDMMPPKPIASRIPSPMIQHGAE